MLKRASISIGVLVLSFHVSAAVLHADRVFSDGYFYHGTTRGAAQSIMSGASIRLTKESAGFVGGFYGCSIADLEEAWQWAVAKSHDINLKLAKVDTEPVILRFKVKPTAQIETLNSDSSFDGNPDILRKKLGWLRPIYYQIVRNVGVLESPTILTDTELKEAGIDVEKHRRLKPYPLEGQTLPKLVEARKTSHSANLEYYREISDNGSALLRKYSESTLFVGIGRSPAPWTAFLSAAGDSRNVKNIPLSSFRHNPSGKTALSPRQEEALFNHFSTFLSIEDLGKYKRMVLIDYTQGALTDGVNSLISAGLYLRRFLESHHIRIQVDLVAINPSVRIRWVALKNGFNLTAIHPRANGGNLTVEQHYQTFDPMAEYDVKVTVDDLVAGNRVYPSQKNPEYQNLIMKFKTALGSSVPNECRLLFH